jgi:short-subunit dehydrogenase
VAEFGIKVIVIQPGSIRSEWAASRSGNRHEVSSLPGGASDESLVDPASTSIRVQSLGDSV